MEILPNANRSNVHDNSYNYIEGNQYVIRSPCTFVQQASSSQLRLPRPSLLSSSLSPQTDQDGSYTGSYWRAADALQDNDLCYLEQFPENDLPPACIISNILDVYYQHIHPIFPLLPLRQAFEAFVDNLSASLSRSTPATTRCEKEAGTALLLALCAYTGRLASASAIDISSVIDASPKLVGDAADLWYEEAIALITQRLQDFYSLEVIQALLLCALRSQGKGNANQAWDFLGRAVRMGQTLGLHRYSIPNQQTKHLGSQVWGVTFFLDLFLSLQLGRPPAIHSFPPTAVTLDAENTAFSYSLSLCRIISRINRCLYPNGDPNKRPRRRTLIHFKTKLNQWDKALPDHFRISNRHLPTREVIELNMLYQFARIILFRHCSERRTLQAATMFDVLLFQYTTFYSLPLSNPHVICLVATAATVDISSGQWRQNLAAHLNLLDCLDAFNGIGKTWDLAERCWKQLDSWMKAHVINSSREIGDDSFRRRFSLLKELYRLQKEWPPAY